MKSIAAITLMILLLTTAAQAYTGRRAVLYSEATVMLAINEP